MQPIAEQSSFRLKSDLPESARVVDVIREADDVVTIWFDREMSFQPGQFILVWVPGMDEKPYAISYTAPGRVAITVSQRGPFSTRLCAMKPGDRAGLRGPYGHGFTIERPAIIVAGGCGVVPLAPLKEKMPEATLICGALKAGDLLFRKRFPDMVICTDDGSAGFRGFPTVLLKQRLERKEARVVYTCGPEVMMRAVFDLCESFGVECQAGLERYMKCGFGVCGQCTCNDRLVCQDGPVFDSKALRRMDEFGRVARLKNGMRVTVKEYGNWRSG